MTTTMTIHDALEQVKESTERQATDLRHRLAELLASIGSGLRVGSANRMAQSAALAANDEAYLAGYEEARKQILGQLGAFITGQTGK